jgi:hypothetical protein
LWWRSWSCEVPTAGAIIKERRKQERREERRKAKEGRRGRLLLSIIYA